MDERKRTKPLEVLSRYKFVLLAAALGAALLLWPTGPGAPEAADSRAPDSGAGAVREWEEAMEAILAEISGVGRVDVMLDRKSVV